MNERRIGLGGAVATLVGYVIGASIFVLPAQLLPDVGAGLVLVYGLAAIPAVFTCVVAAVLGNVYPVSGGSYAAVRALIGPRTAFLTTWLIICAAALGIALVAYGFVDYVHFLWPGLNARWAALLCVLAFMLLNLTPVTVTVAAQATMVVGFVVVILAFGVGGLAVGDWSRVDSWAPGGVSPILTGAVAAFFSYAGLQVLIDIGGEIIDPGRTIPRALGLSFAIVLVLYLLFVLAVVLLSGGVEDISPNAVIGRLATQRFGATAGWAIVVSALLAAATSINGIIFTQARDVQAMASDGRLPKLLSGVSGGIPRPAVLALSGLSLLATAVGASVRQYAVLTAMCLMVVQGILGWAALRVPTQAPNEWEQSAFRLSLGALRFFAFGLVVISALFFALGGMQSPSNALAFGVIAVFGLVVGSFTTRARGHGP